MAASKLTESSIRTFMMDKKELNPLLRGVRFSTEDIDQAVNMCVAYYNETPPLIGSLTPATFPFIFTLLLGVSGHLLRSAAINEASNELQYAADGVTVQDKDKAEIFSKIGGMYWDEFKEKVTNLKITQNLANAFGSNHSELAYMAR